MSELKDLAWQAQSQSPPPELETLLARSRARVRRRRFVAVAASLAAIAVPAVVVLSQQERDVTPDPATLAVRPRSGHELAHSPDAQLVSVLPLAGGNWVALWNRCRAQDPEEAPVCWSTMAFKSASGVEFTEPADDFPVLEPHGDLTYGFRNVHDDVKNRRLIIFENGRPIERPLTVSGTTTAVGDGLILNLAGKLVVVDPRTGRAQGLVLPADLGSPNRYRHDSTGRWWLVKNRKLAWTADGRTWTRESIATKQSWTDASSLDGRTILLHNHDDPYKGTGSYQRSRDSGKTWETIQDPNKWVLQFEAVFNDGTGLVTDITLRNAITTGLYRIAADGAIGAESQTQYALGSIESHGDTLVGLVEGPAITSPSPVPTGTPTPLPPTPEPIRKVALSTNRGVDWQLFEPR
ncbi:hypothetical protein HPO96_11665 [Kribbella sandramycini]|uniref:BNR repeat protein n=1 Tax=Kribbella sandramycini TaxID=60450 RepID=A0A7Y4KYA2_9ACTN|nr:hypothetical protein [Kribbella sandramycini]MBB6569254.1 hypothetical protein [Kribbella sandramycini]NOL40905.1 hypothetical protein [Kribbella sandramycini]